MSNRPFGMSHLVRSTGEQAASDEQQYDAELQLSTSSDGEPWVTRPGALAAERCHAADGNDDANSMLA
jgi:putative ATP-grasp target RiPP